MRLTVNLEEYLYLLAKSISIAEGCSMSAAINLLMRRKHERPNSPRKVKGGFPVARGKQRFTSVDVYKIQQL